MKGLTISCIAFSIFAARAIAAEIPLRSDNLGYSALFQSIYRAAGSSVVRTVLERLGGVFLFIPQSDGGDGGGDGGDGGGGDGSGGDGDGGDGSAGNGGADGGDGEGPGDDTGTVGAQGDTTDNDSPAQSDPTTDAADLSSIANPEDVPTDNPSLSLRGPGSPDAALPPNAALGSAGATLSLPPGRIAPGPGLDVGINAVIVSGAQTPWNAIGKGPGVRNVIVMGGIITLGETPLAKPSPGVTVGAADNPPVWLKLKPDLRYLNGSVFPPIVPNVIDIRIISFDEQVIENPSN